jgi:capsid portal protein
MPAPKVAIEFKPLSDAQQKDALFDNYDKTNREKVRSSFRLPPIFVGLTSDYTRATAHESRSIAEEQVFAPERMDHDFIINRLLFPVMRIRYWKYKSLSPNTNDMEVMAGVLDAFCRCGLTVKEAREEMSRLLNRPLTIPAEEKTEWMGLPLSVYLARLQRGPTDEGEAALMGNAESANKIEKSSGALLLTSLWDIRKALEEDRGGCGHQEHDAP